MKVLVCGGRLKDEELELFVCNILDAFYCYYKISLLIHGGATGVDSYADNWARTRYVEIKSFPADWDKHGKAAGPIRNQQMLDEGKPDIVIAFLSLTNKGTANMVSLAKKAAIKSLLKVIDLR